MFRAAPVGRQRRVYSASSASSRFEQFRAVSSSLLRSLSGGLPPPWPIPKSASGAGCRLSLIHI
eukprot:936540-Alexandrium_andersonii.AAC.2